MTEHSAGTNDNVSSHLTGPLGLLILGAIVALLAIAGQPFQNNLAGPPLTCSLVTYLVRKRSVSLGNAILILGPSDAGKTAIMSSVGMFHIWFVLILN